MSLLRAGASCFLALSIAGCQLAGDTQLTPEPTQTASPEPTQLAPTPTAFPQVTDTPSAVPTPGDLRLESLTWQTITDPFDGTSNDDVRGLFINPNSELVAWGSYQRGSEYTLEHGTGFWVTSDGATWRVSRLGGPGRSLRVSDVASGTGGYVAIADEGGIAGAWWSDDGVTWTRSTISPEPVLEFEYLIAVAAGPEGYLTVGSTGGELGRLAGWFSPTGREWTMVDIDLPSGWFEDLAYSEESGFVAVGNDYTDGAQAAVWRISPDGLDWERGEIIGRRGMEQLSYIRHFSGGFVAFGMYAQPGDTFWCKACSFDPDFWRAYTSLDGMSWDRHKVAGNGEVTPALSWYGAVEPWQDGLIGVGRDTDGVDRVWTSSDGVIWEPVGEPIGTSGEAAYRTLLVDGSSLILGGTGEYGGIVAIGTTSP